MNISRPVSVPPTEYPTYSPEVSCGHASGDGSGRPAKKTRIENLSDEAHSKAWAATLASADYEDLSLDEVLRVLVGNLKRVTA